MTDEAKALVERLRNEAAMVSEDVFQSDPETLDEAADLIETQARDLDRLWEALHAWDDKTKWVQDTAQPHELGLHRADVLRTRIETQAREIERLNSILSEMNDTDVIARTMAENERLREALEEWMFRYYWRVDGMNIEQARIHARAALQETAVTSERTCHFTGDDAWKCGTSCTCQHFNWNNKGQAAMTSEPPLNFKTEIERLRFFVAGLASLNLNTPRGKRHDVHHAQQLREIRNAARLLLKDMP